MGRWLARLGEDVVQLRFATDEEEAKILNMFHHIHYDLDEEDEVHHCGGDHKGEDLDYTVDHCSCGEHSIDKEEATGHDLELNPVDFKFTEECPDGGWHIESGERMKEAA